MLLSLGDLSNTLEIVRRTRRELPAGSVRDSMDCQLLQITEHISHIIGEDERVIRHLNAEKELFDTKPPTINWNVLKMSGVLAKLVAQVAAGVAANAVWKAYEQIRD